MTAKRWYLNTLSGIVDRLDEHVAVHPVFAKHLVEVEPGTKSYSPELYKPTTAVEYIAAHKKADKAEGDKK